MILAGVLDLAIQSLKCKVKASPTGNIFDKQEDREIWSLKFRAKEKPTTFPSTLADPCG